MDGVEETTAYTLTHYGKFRDTNLLTVHLFGQGEETEYSEENPKQWGQRANSRQREDVGILPPIPLKVQGKLNFLLIIIILLAFSGSHPPASSHHQLQTLHKPPFSLQFFTTIKKNISLYQKYCTMSQLIYLHYSVAIYD